MNFRILLMLALVLAVSACDSPQKKKEKELKAKRNDIPDQTGDVGFQSFIGRLNKAVQMHDLQTMSTMMTSNFGYRLEPPGEGDGVFQYWDQNNVWLHLQIILQEKFVPKGNFMVAPEQFANDQQYNGWRAGMVQVNGSWKFAYFVKD